VAPQWRADQGKPKCIGIGLALGIVFGVAFHSYGLRIGIGIAIGLGIWFFQRRRGGRRLEDAPCARNIEAVDCGARWE
jgi:hypothetical protein